MGRYGRRVSRSLIGVLIITLVLGLAFYLKDIGSTRASEAKPISAGAGSSLTSAQRNAGALPVSTQIVNKLDTPTTKPSQPGDLSPATQPANAARWANAISSPSTRPAGASVDLSKTPLADAQAKKDAGDLLGARRILNAALLSGRLSAAEFESAKKSIADINQTVVFSPKRFADDEFGGTYSVQPGDRLTKIAEKYEVPWQMLLRLNGMTDAKKLRAGQTLKVVHGPFNLVVTKGKFTMDVYLGPPAQAGSMYITTFPVGLGKNDSTPTGTWTCEAGKKIINPTYFSPRGEGVIDADDPKNPLGERWIGLAGIDGHALGKSSYGIHGTIDETSIGKQESMGCIRMHNADVEMVFDMVVDGKSIVVVKD